MGDVNIDHHVVEEDLIPMEEDVEVWDDDMVAHEVTVEDDEYIQVEDTIDVGNAYGHIHGHEQVDHTVDLNSISLELLPMRHDGTPLYSMNLPDMLSRSLPLVGMSGEPLVLCFNKKATQQIVCDGFIYTIQGYLNSAAYNIWNCCVEGCTGAIRTSPNFSAWKLRSDHSEGCIPDPLQVRMRVSIYDLRLMAEFTECDLPNLYDAFVEKMRQEHNPVVDIFPEFESLQIDIANHRNEQIFRKRFEIRRSLNNRRQQGLVIEKGQFKRTKAFPPSICVECNAEFPSGDLAPSQDLLIQHLTYQHERPLVIERYTFHEAALFEQWIRELAQHSRYRMRKVGLYDEHMYYLCHADDRQHRCNHGKGHIISNQCSAFIRVHDWRYILRRDLKPVVVDYCLDHSFHTGSSPLPESYRQPLYDYYSPEVFMKEVETRRHRTQRLLMSSSSNSMERIKRPHLAASSSMMHYGARPISESEMYMVDSYGPEGEMDMNMQGHNTLEWGNEEEIYEQAPIHEQPQQVPHRVSFTTIKRDAPILREGQLEGNRASNHVTIRSNFEDRATFENVMQLELYCDMIKQRMQLCRRPDVARRYLSRVLGIHDEIMADPLCAPRADEAVMEETAPSTSKFQTRRQAAGEPPAKKIATPTGKQVITVRTLPATDGSSPVRQAMFLKRGENGEMIVVKKIIRKVRKSVQVVGDEESIVQPLPSAAKSEESFEPMDEQMPSTSQACQQPANNHEEEQRSAHASADKGGDELPATFLETTTPVKRARRGRSRH